MIKNWLIRTKNHQILGPVSLKKIKELLEKGSLKEDDEVSSGNGYWFFLREEELVQKYLKNEIPQDFNPVSEADSVLAVETIEQEVENSQLPSEDDLEFPDDIIDEKESILNQLKTEEVLSSLPEVSEDEEDIDESAPVQRMEVPVKRLKPVSQVAPVKKGMFNQNLLLVLAGILFVLALAGFYFRKQLIKEFIEANISIFPAAYAQVIPDSVKKKLII